MGKIFRKLKAQAAQEGKTLHIVGKGKPSPEVEQEAVSVAAPVSVPSVETVTEESGTESSKKKAARGGKRTLSVTRSSGKGINI